MFARGNLERIKLTFRNAVKPSNYPWKKGISSSNTETENVDSDIIWKVNIIWGY